MFEMLSNLREEREIGGRHGNIQPSHHTCTVQCNSCQCYSYHIRIKLVRLKPSFLLSCFLLWYILMGPSRADIYKTRKRKLSFFKYLFVAGTTSSESIDLLDGRSTLSSSALLSVTKVNNGASSSIFQNQQCLKQECQLQPCVTNMEQTRSLCFAVRIVPLLCCVPQLYPHQLPHSLTTLLSWN